MSKDQWSAKQTEMNVGHLWESSPLPNRTHYLQIQSLGLLPLTSNHWAMVTYYLPTHCTWYAISQSKTNFIKKRSVIKKHRPFYVLSLWINPIFTFLIILNCYELKNVQRHIGFYENNICSFQVYCSHFWGIYTSVAKVHGGLQSKMTNAWLTCT